MRNRLSSLDRWAHHETLCASIVAHEARLALHAGSPTRPMVRLAGHQGLAWLVEAAPADAAMHRAMRVEQDRRCKKGSPHQSLAGAPMHHSRTLPSGVGQPAEFGQRFRWRFRLVLATRTCERRNQRCRAHAVQLRGREPVPSASVGTSEDRGRVAVAGVDCFSEVFQEGGAFCVHDGSVPSGHGQHSRRTAHRGVGEVPTCDLNA